MTADEYMRNRRVRAYAESVALREAARAEREPIARVSFTEDAARRGAADGV